MRFLAIRFGVGMTATVLLAAGVVILSALTPAASGGLHPLLHALGIISCSAPTPCQEGNNAGTGPGLEGISAKGSGVVGQTTFRSTSPSNGQAGVLGQDKSTSGMRDSGVAGTTVRGYGVVGTAQSGAGVGAKSSSGCGLCASSSSGYGVYATSNSWVGVFGQSSLYFGVYGSSVNAAAVRGDSSGDAGAWLTGGGTTGVSLVPALTITGNANNPDLIYACAFNGSGGPCTSGGGFPTPQFAAINNGNVFITGQIFTSGSCHNGCAPTQSTGEKRVRFFTPRESLPTIEDFGEAQLVRGQAYVRIDPSFANTLDGREPYMVFLTPKGDSNGLYVINPTAAGFEVRENRGGTSTLAFSYRIVARPYGQHATRLQMITVTRPGRSLPESRFQ